MKWSDAVSAVQTLEVAGRGDASVRGVQYDSRRVTGGDVFVAMRGGTVDGNRFIDAAIQKGAAAVITDSRETFIALREKQPELAIALADYGRRALAEISAATFGHPEQQLKLSAVTGTNGKTTTAFLLEQILCSVGRKCMLLGTIETHVAGIVRESEHTTPESRDILALFSEGVHAGCTEAVMEMSSHALEQERVWGLQVDVAMFTNLTQDHLDYHGTMTEYAKAKSKLFAGVGTPPPRVAVIHQGAEYSSMMADAFAGNELMAYGIGSYGSYRAEELHLALGDTRFRFATPQGSIAIHSPLSGRVNVENLLAAMCAALARGLSLEEIAVATEALHQVPGRFQVVSGSKKTGITVIVDYAHTDDALQNLIRLARESVATSGGRVITLFGCGGDRDKTKRPKMGRVAGEGSDVVIVTSDNPRSEDPEVILHEAYAGVHETNAECFVEEDRRKAIALAIHSARPGDMVLIAGKGHEKVQILGHGIIPFDDVEEAQSVLKAMKIGVAS
jgi:UDP-N-acetylmuramoyl-L-alanyl-D-glutamate--2,6-diaminopimelate ligase